jgi:hypothetical protein
MEVYWRSSCFAHALEAHTAVLCKAAGCTFHYNVVRPGGDGPLKVLHCLVQGIKIRLKTLSSPGMCIQHPSQL